MLVANTRRHVRGQTVRLQLDLRRLLTGNEAGDLSEAEFSALYGAETAEREQLRAQVVGSLSRAVLLYAGGRQLQSEVVLPEQEQAEGAESEVVLRMKVPPGRSALGLRTSEMLGTVALSAWVDEVQVMDRVPVAPGGAPEPIAVSVEEESGARTALRYLWQGVLHIVPLGLDHILFVLALALLSLRWRPAVLQATARDVVLLAGKGHEDRQIVGSESRPFSDRQVVLDALGVEA
jgi:hypothetical protein